jgi:hypothetical protein
MWRTSFDLWDHPTIPAMEVDGLNASDVGALLRHLPKHPDQREASGLDQLLKSIGAPCSRCKTFCISKCCHCKAPSGSRIRAFNMTVTKLWIPMQARRASTWIVCSVLQIYMCVQRAPQASGHLWALSELLSSGKTNQREAQQGAAKR